jgi:hypothetical protein
MAARTADLNERLHYCERFSGGAGLCETIAHQRRFFSG